MDTGEFIRFVGEGVLLMPHFVDCNDDVIIVSQVRRWTLLLLLFPVLAILHWGCHKVGKFAGVFVRVVTPASRLHLPRRTATALPCSRLQTERSGARYDATDARAGGVPQGGTHGMGDVRVCICGGLCECVLARSLVCVCVCECVCVCVHVSLCMRVCASVYAWKCACDAPLVACGGRCVIPFVAAAVAPPPCSDGQRG